MSRKLFGRKSFGKWTTVSFILALACAASLPASDVRAHSVCIGTGPECAGSGLVESEGWILVHGRNGITNRTCEIYARVDTGRVVLRSNFTPKPGLDQAKDESGRTEDPSADEIIAFFNKPFEHLEVGPVTLHVELVSEPDHQTGYRFDDGAVQSLTVVKNDLKRASGLSFPQPGPELDAFLTGLAKGEKMFVLAADQTVLAEVSLKGSARAVAAWRACHDRVLRRIKQAKKP